MKIPVSGPVSVAVKISPGKGSELEKARTWTVSTVEEDPRAGSALTLESFTVTVRSWSQS